MDIYRYLHGLILSFLSCPQSQLDTMKLNRLHAATMAPMPSHFKTREEKGEVRPHQRVGRASSDDNGRLKSAIPENRISTIPEITVSFERRLCLRDKKTVSSVRRCVTNCFRYRPSVLQIFSCALLHDAVNDLRSLRYL